MMVHAVKACGPVQVRMARGVGRVRVATLTLSIGAFCFCCAAYGQGGLEDSAGVVATREKDVETVSLCDYWPLAVGNTLVYSGQGEVAPGMEVTDRLEINGFPVYEVTYAEASFGAAGSVYYVPLQGYLYWSPTVSGVSTLPTVSGQMTPFLPLEYVPGQAFTFPGWSGDIVASVGWLTQYEPTSGEFTVSNSPAPDAPEVLALDFGEFPAGSGRRVHWIFERGVGPLHVNGISLETADIVGGCDYRMKAAVSVTGGWHEEGQPLSLSANVERAVGSIYYQWRKDGASIVDATGETLHVASLNVSDAGWYSCHIEDDSSGVFDTEPVHVQVFPEGSLPVAGVAGMAAACMACAALAARKLARRG